MKAKRKRAKGTGSVTWHAGKWRARMPPAHGRRNVGLFATEDEAHDVLDAALVELAADPVPLGITLDGWGTAWLEGLAASPHYKRRSVARDVDRWRCYVSRSLLGRTALVEVTEQDVRRWLRGLRKRDGKPLAGQSLSNALSLVRRALEAARQDGRVPVNVAADVKLPKGARTQSGETEWLRADEVERVVTCDAIPLRSRIIYTVAIYAGLRAGELWGLRWSDVDFARGVIHVRRSYDQPPKSWQVREVQMLAPVVDALTLWRRVYDASGVRSRHDLVWPGADEGCHHQGYDAGWAKRDRELARVRRSVRFHDLRHTCASHLLIGSWVPRLLERPLRLEEVKTWLGHSSIKVTERYSHLEASRMRSLVVPASGHDGDTTDSHLRELNSRPTVYETGREPPNLRAIEGKSAPVSRDVSRLAARYLDAVERGDARRDAMGVDLAIAVLEQARADEAREGAA